jgi:hypothetical protein
MEIQRGNPYSAQIIITDEEENAYDLTDKTIMFTVKKQQDSLDDDSAALIQKNITVHTNAASGISVLTLTAVETKIAIGEYKYDLRIYQSGVVQANTLPAICEVSDIVTKRTS